ncbi:Thioredoxin-related transmembrane protein 1 [Eumeta japonica]|uniref:Thioredoxin-related transmembrane protein 1 n=1 Tax=Eumeta variegata TaxID=151549 RepID=A0A4C1UKE4_EUMVA|nr:Thioredoxin-related transmembrane protein 1 [Eumeta japonica]
MARVQKTLQFLLFSVYLCVVYCRLSDIDSLVKDLNEDNWKDILQGEWMVEFYAPWCPACNALQPAWRELSTKLSEAKAAAVDVTQAPGLSGRFVVTALPTIYHVKNGEFRQYKGPRDAQSMVEFVHSQRWKQTEPIPSWKAPDSFQMSLVANFFKLSQILRTVHNTLMETYGLPTWGSYLIFAIATIFTGALLGLILVCAIDFLYPPKKLGKILIKQSELDALATGDQDSRNKSDDDTELINDDIVDESEAARADSDAEKNSPSDVSTT